MEKSELKKQFKVSLFNNMILITTPSNNLEAYRAELNLPLGKEIKIGWHDWIETEENALNYYECCGVLILFGIIPPSLDELCRLVAPSDCNHDRYCDQQTIDQKCKQKSGCNFKF